MSDKVKLLPLFWEFHKEALIPLYKSSLVVWTFGNTPTRTIPPLRLVKVLENQIKYYAFILPHPDDNETTTILYGCPVSNNRGIVLCNIHDTGDEEEDHDDDMGLSLWEHQRMFRYFTAAKNLGIADPGSDDEGHDKTIEMIEKEDTPKTENGLDGFTCDECGSSLSRASLHCEQCNYDLCSECAKTTSHDHPMFCYCGYFGITTIDKNDILEEFTVSIE